MKIKVRDAATLVGGKIYGNENCEFDKVSKIEEAKDGSITFLYLPAYVKYLRTTGASVILIKPDIDKIRDDLIYIEVENPNIAFQKIISEYFTPEIKLNGIDPGASVDPNAKIGENVALGKNVVISSGCTIGNSTKIYHNTVLMENVSVGNDTLLYPNVTVREDCEIGNRVIIHSGTVIGSDGFGYTHDDKGVYYKIPQIGNVVIEDDVEIGSNVSIDRAAVGSTVIKKGVKLDNLIQIAHNVVVGENTAMSAQTGISGSTKIGDRCVFGGQVGLVGHVQIADGVSIGAQSGVSKSITKPGIYFGSPTKELQTALRLELHIRSLPGYVERIKKLEEKIKSLEKQEDKLKEGGNS